jgi:hypothetical protein
MNTESVCDWTGNIAVHGHQDGCHAKCVTSYPEEEDHQRDCQRELMLPTG